ncbi:MAG: hypothetical protein GY750_10700 [Lentisphaerae bacterium]|nr:hypothetical protein [Lentisphaerota bacterium]MCP4101879.1 hypothetical protein [Lentisphaerota bacterium]
MTYCSCCSNETSDKKFYSVPSGDIPFISTYSRVLKNHIQKYMNGKGIFYDGSASNLAYDLYHIPLSRKCIDLIKKVAPQNKKNIIEAVQNIFAPVSMANCYDISLVRNDLLSWAGLNSENHPEKNVPVCSDCMFSLTLPKEIAPLLEKSIQDEAGVLAEKQIQLCGPTTPFNIQLAIAFNRLFSGSDIIILLHSHSEKESVYQFLSEYMKMHSHKFIGIGAEYIDSEAADIQAFHTYCHQQGLVSRADTDCNMKSLCFSLESPFNDPNFKPFFNFVKFNCPNAFCFGFAPLMTEEKYSSTVAKRIVGQFSNINSTRHRNDKIPFVIPIGYEHGMSENNCSSVDSSTREYIQDCIKQKFKEECGSTCVVRTVHATPGDISELRYISNNRCKGRIDFELKFQLPRKYESA